MDILVRGFQPVGAPLQGVPAPVKWGASINLFRDISLRIYENELANL